MGIPRLDCFGRFIDFPLALQFLVYKHPLQNAGLEALKLSHDAGQFVLSVDFDSQLLTRLFDGPDWRSLAERILHVETIFLLLAHLHQRVDAVLVQRPHLLR